MTITVPASDVNGYALQAAITAQVAVNATLASNSPHMQAANVKLIALQDQLVDYLIGNGKIKSANILSTGTYGV